MISHTGLVEEALHIIKSEGDPLHSKNVCLKWLSDMDLATECEVASIAPGIHVSVLGEVVNSCCDKFVRTGELTKEERVVLEYFLVIAHRAGINRR